MTEAREQASKKEAEEQRSQKQRKALSKLEQRFQEQEGTSDEEDF